MLFFGRQIRNVWNGGNEKTVIILIACIVAVFLAGFICFFYLNDESGAKRKGFSGKIYNFLLFNRFSSEYLLKLIYVLGACLLTCVSIAYTFLYSFAYGPVILIFGNMVLRIIFELLIMYVLACKRVAYMDKRLSVIERYFLSLAEKEENEQLRAMPGAFSAKATGAEAFDDEMGAEVTEAEAEGAEAAESSETAESAKAFEYAEMAEGAKGVVSESFEGAGTAVSKGSEGYEGRLTAKFSESVWGLELSDGEELAYIAELPYSAGLPEGTELSEGEDGGRSTGLPEDEETSEEENLSEAAEPLTEPSKNAEHLQDEELAEEAEGSQDAEPSDGRKYLPAEKIEDDSYLPYSVELSYSEGLSGGESFGAGEGYSDSGELTEDKTNGNEEIM